MSTQEQVFELLQETGTNWRALKKPLFDAEGNPANHFGVFRSDNNQAIGNVGEKYHILQNAELAETIVEAASGLVGDFKGGLFKGGGRIYYQGELPDEQIAKDTVKRNLTAMNSHDGSSSIGFGFANTVVSCNNSFYKAMKEIQRFRHTATASERLEVARKEIQMVLKAENELIENYKRMADTPVNDAVKKKVIADLFNFKEDDWYKEHTEFSTRKQKKLEEFAEVMGSEMAQKGETMWGLFNSVTYKTNHLDTKEEKALESLMIGAGFRKNLGAYTTIVDALPKQYSLS